MSPQPVLTLPQCTPTGPPSYRVWLWAPIPANGWRTAILHVSSLRPLPGVPWGNSIQAWLTSLVTLQALEQDWQLGLTEHAGTPGCMVHPLPLLVPLALPTPPGLSPHLQISGPVGLGSWATAPYLPGSHTGPGHRAPSRSALGSSWHAQSWHLAAAPAHGWEGEVWDPGHCSQHYSRPAGRGCCPPPPMLPPSTSHTVVPAGQISTWGCSEIKIIHV